MNRTLADVTRAHYEDLIGRIGSGYVDYRWQGHAVSRSHYRQTRKAVEFAFAQVGIVGNVLEIGCGPGTWTDICLAHARQLTIVDISSEMLRLVGERFGNDSPELLCGDFISSAVVLPRTFDLVFSARALEYMDDKAAMVAKSVGQLNPGGRLVVITKNPAWMDKRREDRRITADAEEDIQGDWIDWRSLEAHYRHCGLTDVVTYPVCFGSYYQPLRNALGIRACERLQARTHRKPLRAGIEFLTESYMTMGHKPLKGVEQ